MKMKNMSKAWSAVALCGLLCFGLAGCGNPKIPTSEESLPAQESAANTALQPDETVTLRVVTEISNADGVNQQAQLAKEAFEAAHEDVTVEIIILPTDTEERTVALEQLRSQRAEGTGPDVYLLPTGKNVDDISGKRVYVEVEPVFYDVAQSMRGGAFADISRYYDADDTLGKDALNQTVMDAGALGDKRYVLPLRYDVPVIYADLEALAEVGITRRDLEGSVIEMMDAAMKSGDPKTALAASLIPRAEQLFAHAIDYDNQTVLLEEQTVASLLEKRKCLEQMCTALREQEDFVYPRPLLLTYVHDGDFWCLNGYPMYPDSLRTAMENAAMFAHLDRELTMLPLRSTEGTWIASVTYYGAVDARSKNVELAYAYLRTFLTEDYQWAENVELAYGNSCLVHNSWPVRSVGSVAPLWSRLQVFFKYCCVPGDERAELARPFRDEAVAPTDERIKLLQVMPDEVVFPVACKGNLSWDQLEYEALAEDSDVHALAGKWVTAMEQQLAEG